MVLSLHLVRLGGESAPRDTTFLDRESTIALRGSLLFKRVHDHPLAFRICGAGQQCSIDRPGTDTISTPLVLKYVTESPLLKRCVMVLGK